MTRRRIVSLWLPRFATARIRNASRLRSALADNPPATAPLVTARIDAGVEQQRVDERAVRVARRGMHDEPGWLIDHEEIVVFVKNRERDVLRQRLGWRRRRGPNDHALSRANSGLASGDEPIDVYVLGDFGGTQGVTSECVEENNLAIFLDVTCVNLE